MAQRHLVQITDDLDGAQLQHHDAEEVRFGLDGTAYVIDLSHTHARELRDRLRRYVDAATRTTTSTAAPSRGRKPTTGPRSDLDQVRTWARANGHTVADRGRIPAAILNAFDTAH